ncbi:MAG: aminomethyl-transferring glycine dehydrogenase subunit GcvPA [Deltaproteobacteria bacterium]|nr:aminomethyl-transferring glycine dehydrogenase subunit GcvPA [Deltaproteobacteria bacterium]MBW2264726.1 aminomethyl-transferring glycine dehydrogenase subunit GcvPA [Deltaproteobacteria bacterium]MBW2317292.1 aminomethyl-transferring glycine dehydrogenase subunit GcvPA [Deltaproteobacteria bacterium]MBW2601264.1 aminomethyl-transferring glycine dehydrogenase subunit GcvPA [Deltaproteobacteria bacterium]
MRYLPHTDKDIASMLQAVGVDDLDALFMTIPEDCRFAGDLDLPQALTEWELNEHMQGLAGNMAVLPEYKVFMGAGSYEHFIPACVPYLLGRSEFVTSYTPYQPEMSQGTLQAIYEYQTLTARLLGMEIATASHYDGATALAESLLMAIRLTKRKRVAISSLIHPLYRRVVRTYFEPTGYEVVELGYLKEGVTDLSALGDMDDLAAVAVQSPNFFGCIENLQAVGEKVHDKKALFIASFTEALSYGLLNSPGSQGADIACGEGQSMGIPQTFGGPALGMLASRKKYMRSLPGRLVGQTKDLDGKRGFVLTLATREQHIRREKATSNICTNNSLCALCAAMYMASVGGTGIRELACLNHDKAEYLKKGLKEAGFQIAFDNPTFNEFVVKFPAGFNASYERLLEKKIVAGLPLASYYPELANHYLLCVTETRSKEDMDAFVREVAS